MGHKLDPRAKELVLTVVAVGGTLKMAAEMIGCTERALYYAKDQDPEFDKAILERKNTTEFVCLRTMNSAAEDPKNWAAAYCLLKTLNPERYSRRPDMLPVETVKVMMKELGMNLSRAVTSDQSRQEIVDFMDGAIRDLRAGKLHKRKDSRHKKDDPPATFTAESN
jgi:hypothetical protein